MATATPPGGAHGVRRSRRRPGENRERLLEAGIGEFGTLGYHGASTGSIAALAGVPQPHVYASFATKHDLFIACAERVVARVVESRSADSDDTAARFLLQLVSSLGDAELRRQLLPLALELREALGEERFTALLARAAESMVRGR